ncbi:MAG: carboxypeptidase-like regulatory domain-containing protein [Candidatus Magasanikbacteria bacterium]|nr:carboxypeptidase-like regulatory domain-containing protein [Candidatus Magasanikbacteria bacterium]
MHFAFSSKFENLKDKIWIAIFLIYVALIGTFFAVMKVQAAGTVTVCASGCDHTTITAAYADALLTSGGTVQVNATYDPTTETGYPNPTLTPSFNNIAIDCLNSGAYIGVLAGASTTTIDFGTTSGGSVNNCNIRNVAINGTLSNANISVIGNTFDLASWSTITLNGTNPIIQNNTGNILITLTNSTNPLIDGNSLVGSLSFASIITQLGSPPVLTTITNNTFTINNFDGITWSLVGGDLVFATNTLKFTGIKTSVDNPILRMSSGNFTLNGNFISVPFTMVQPLLSFGSGGFVVIDTNVQFNHNTVVWPLTVGDTILFNTPSGANLIVNANYNLLYNSTPTYIGNGGVVGFRFERNTSNLITVTNDYNGTYGFGQALRNYGTAAVVVGSHDKTTDPHLRLENASTADDLYPAPWSDYLDVNGSVDMGAYSAARRNNIYVADGGTVDYSSVDATNTVSIVTSTAGLRNGDTVHLSSGTYTMGTIASSTQLTSGLTITGAASGIGAGTPSIVTCVGTANGPVFNGINSLSISGVQFRDTCTAGSQAIKISNAASATISDVKITKTTGYSPNGLVLSGVTNSAFSTVYATGFTSSTAVNYLISVSALSYAGNNYSDGTALGGTAQNTLILSGPGCTTQNTDDSLDVATAVGAATGNWNVALVSVPSLGGARMTMWAPNDLYASEASVTAACSGFGVVVDKFVTSAFTVSGGIFTYDSAGVASAGVSVAPGFTTPPTLTRSRLFYGAGFDFETGSTGNTFSAATSTGNTCGLLFAGNSSSNVLTDFQAVTSGDFDLCDSSSADNSLKAPVITASSASLTGAGAINLLYKTRGQILDTYSAPVSGATVTIHDTLSSSSTVMTTNVSGLTPYSDYFTAIKLTNGSTGNTAGGYNPFVISTADVGGLYASSTSANLIAQDQTLTLYMSSTTPTVTVDPCGTSGCNSHNAVIPTIASFVLNGGSTSTTSTFVSVILTATNAVQMSISENSSFVGAVLESYTSAFTHLFTSAVAGLKTLYAKVVSSTGNESTIAVQSITYDSTATSTPPVSPLAPTGSLAINSFGNSGMTSSTSIILIPAYSESATQMKISNSATFATGVWQSVMGAVNWTVATGDGDHVVYIKYRDVDGLESAIYSAHILLDTTPPPVPQIVSPADGAKIVGTTVAVFGTAEPLTTIDVSILNGATLVDSATFTSGPDGSWGFVPQGSFAPASYHIVAHTRDALGNRSADIDAFFAVLAAEPLVSLSVSSPIDGVVVNSPTFSAYGTSMPGSSVVVTLDGKKTFITLAGMNGSWKLPLLLPDVSGVYSLEFKSFDNKNTLIDAVQRNVELKKVIIIPPPIKPPAEPDTPTPTTPSVGGGGGATSSTYETTSTVPLVTASTTEPLLPDQIPVSIVDTANQQVAQAIQNFSDSSPVAAQVVTQTKLAAARVSRAATAAAKAVSDVAAQPQVQAVNQAVVVPAAAVATVATVGSALNFGQIALYFRFLFTQPLFLFTRKRRTGWGMTYNAFTKMPADLALVRIVDTKTQRVVQSSVTDRDGRYQFFVEPGSYSIEVTKPSYNFPPAFLTGKTDDGKLTDLYTGGALNLAASSHVSYNLPLDPGGEQKPTKEILREKTKQKLASALSASGVALTAVSFAVSPTPIVGAFLAAHVVSYFVFRRLAAPRKPKSWAIITDAVTGKPVSRAVVRIFDKQYNKLLETQVTDNEGRYAFLVGKNDYYVMVEKQGYETATTGTVSVPDAPGGSVLAQDIKLAPPKLVAA